MKIYKANMLWDSSKKGGYCYCKHGQLAHVIYKDDSYSQREIVHCTAPGCDCPEFRQEIDFTNIKINMRERYGNSQS